MGRIGFCCKYVEPHPKKVFESVAGLNTGTTTISWLNRQSRDVAEQKLWDLMVGNIEAVYKLVERVSTLDPSLRMVRIGSDILPAYTHDSYADYWRQADIISYAETNFKRVGDLARANDVRLSFHPGQFTVLASDNPGIVERSIAEFEYHADMARWMGYGKAFQDFKINVHISGRQGPEGIRRAYKKLSLEARNCITIENEEISHNLEAALQLADLLPIVLDIHHHWINSGEYISPNDDRVKRVIDSWRGVRPACHYSVSREDVLVNHARDVLPSMADLLALGYKKQALRAHSDFYWNSAVNTWASGFAQDFDIQCESKCKNLASKEFANFIELQ
ncbi:Uve UV damage repair endonuclease [uncultured Caudovirales phage]|uniref:Uve UV damage repair endonuclease n=1 Tax=uncultured Caudovirales phage TaxID=2100421 RepID=A0A6J5T9Z6_9CAUD|nr:Uve UV damage repair endonuclease [uncultured Caudovirales phage]